MIWLNRQNCFRYVLTMWLYRPALATSLALVVTLWAVGTSVAGADEPVGKRWALLIGVENYQKAEKLQFTVNDVRQMAAVLVSHGGYDPMNILSLTDEGPTDADRPLKAALEKRIPEWLKKPGPQDSIIVYFSGHGFRDDKGQLYLAPLDCDPHHAPATGLAMEWFREQLEKCPAQWKFLVLDACHAGSEKGDLKATATAKDITSVFKASPAVITLASSTGEELSQIWDSKQQSLFSYWLKEGLKGHADASGDGQVSIDELYEYVYGHVLQTAQVRFSRPQTPVRNMGPRTLGVPVVVRLVPQSLKQVIADMSEQLSGTMDERQLAKMGVLEFTNDTKLGEMLGANFGLLGKLCADELERNLLNRCAGKYKVINRDRIQSALGGQPLALKDLASAEKLKTLAKNTRGMAALARGTLADRSGRLVTIRCKLVQTDGDETFTTVGGLAKLSESEWAMLGRSVEVRPEDREPSRPATSTTASNASVVAPKAPEDRVIEAADERSRGPHPLHDPNFPFPVKIMIGGKERQLQFKKMGDGNEEREECYVQVKKDEVYSVRIGNRSGFPAIMRFLVDGLNTLPEMESDTKVVSNRLSTLPEKESDTKGVSTWVTGKRMSLEDARFWFLDPNAAKTYPPTKLPATSRKSANREKCEDLRLSKPVNPWRSGNSSPIRLA